MNTNAINWGGGGRGVWLNPLNLPLPTALRFSVYSISMQLHNVYIAHIASTVVD